MTETATKKTPAHKQSIAGEEDPGSSADSTENAADSAPPPAHVDRRVAERDEKQGDQSKSQ